MAASDQCKYIQFLNLMNAKDFFNNVSETVISPLLNCLCVITSEKDAFLYLLPNCENIIEPFWRSPSKVQRCLFSEDGKNILIILKVNSFLIYTISDENVSLLVQVKASILANLLQNYSIAACRVDPLKLKKHELIVMIDKNLVVNIEWTCLRAPALKYLIPIKFYKDIFINEKFMFVLNDFGIINAYSVLNGEKCQVDLNVSAIFVGHSFFKLSIHADSKIMAVVNEVEEIILFESNELFNDEKNAGKALSETKREKWTWPYKSRKSKENSKAISHRILGKVFPPSGLVVSHLQFSLKGLFAFYCIMGQSKCSSFKVIDEESGIVLYNFDGLVESKIISGAPLPLLMTDSILSVCLGVLCNDHFVIKLCEVVPSFGFSRELERTLPSQDGSLKCHLAFLKIILNLHANVFHSDLKSLIARRAVNEKVDFAVEINFSERKIMERISELFKVVLEYKEDEVESDFGVKEVMLTSCFLHAVHLLDVTQMETRAISGVDLFHGLLKQILILFERVKARDPLEEDWINWLEMTDAEIVRESVVVGALSLAHVFFVTKRNWSIEEVERKFKAEADAWISELVKANELEKAKIALVNLGREPVQHLKSLCLDATARTIRDTLAKHLVETNRFGADEVEAWNLNRQIESALASSVKRHHTFEQKMNVSAKERVNPAARKLQPYDGSISLNTILKSSQEWRNMVLTEVYFSTGDVTLEKTLKKELCWQYLIETNQLDLLKNWIDISCDPSILVGLQSSADYLTRSYYNLFAEWPVTEFMLNSMKDMKCMTATKNSVLDGCASYGLFSTAEKKSLRNIVFRLENNSLLSAIKATLSKPTSNLSVDDFRDMVFEKSAIPSLKPVIWMCLSDSILPKDSPAFEAFECLWLEAWTSFCSWQNDRQNKIILADVIKKSSQICPECNSKELSFIDVALALIEEREISDLIKSEGKNCCLLQLPLIEINWQTARSTNDRKPDVSLYDLLQCSNLPVKKLFLWQSQNGNWLPPSNPDVFSEFPHFNHQLLGMKYGYRQSLDYVYYLKQGRPSFACNLFVVESLRTKRRLTTKMIKRVCGTAHGLALRFWRDNSVGSACVAFIAMLGDIASANVLRIHLGAIECTCDYLSKTNRHYISTLARGIAEKESLYVQEMASILERSVIASAGGEKSVAKLEKWHLPVSFSNVHGLPLPALLLKSLAQNHDWFSFVICMDIFRYPYEQAIEIIELIDSKILKSHLIRALTRTTLKLSTTSPSKSPPKILLEPENNEKDDFESGNGKDNKDVFQSFVTNIYTEVLNTIQTFTDKNIVLPWSCEQDPDDDVLLTLLKCESEPDSSKSLLVSSIELQSPALAVLATCFQSDNVFPNLIAWLVSSIPTSMSRTKRREEGQQLVDRLFGSKEVETLFINFFSTGYFQTFFRGMNLFLSENPMTLFLNAVYHGIVLLDFETAFELLKEFAVEVVHFRAKEPTSFFSKSWILNVVGECIGNLLTRSDLLNSTKRQFLRILAESDLSSVDAGFPNYLMWSQICEILESSETNLDFIQLHDVTMVSDELQNCLDVLVKNCRFAQALEICSLLSLNKDKYVIEMWKHNLNASTKNAANVRNVWKDSSAAFKDENVSPNLAASFYYEMASRFQSASADSLKNRYFALENCLHWRRFTKDTLSASFREESDAIELEKWKCCIEPNFDISLLLHSDPVDVSHSLLLSVWSATKVLIRSRVLDDFEKKRVDDLIHLLLDRGDLHGALRLSAFFKCDCQDLTSVTCCLKAAQEELTPSELSKVTAAPGESSFRSQSVDESDLAEYEVVPSKKQHQTLSLLDKLCQAVKHGKCLAGKIFVCYRLSVNLDVTFKEIASERDYLSLLPRSVSLGGVNKFNVASDLITLADLPGIDLAQFLREKIVSSIMEFHSADLAVSVTLWDVSLDKDFHLIVNLMENPSLLGSELLQASMNLPCSAGVEVLIRAHDCFTASCNVEGIGKVLRRARILASLALLKEQWNHLVRLLVGIERYSDMSYIFQMLKDNGQFEQLLRKGMHKVAGLHVAISEFLQRHCPQDRELSKMVAAHFGLHSKLALFWEEEADEIITKLPVVDNILKDSGKTRQALNLAIDNYSHAIQWFLQAGKLNRALKTAHKAQMVGLQISLLGGPFILRLKSRAEFQFLANGRLSVAQIMLISRAHDLEPDWASVLHERWVLKGDKNFFADLKSSLVLSPQLIRNYALRYDSETIANGKAKDRMKQLLMSSGQMLSPLLKDLRQN